MRKILMKSHAAFHGVTSLERPPPATPAWHAVPATSSMASEAEIALWQLNAAGRGRYSLAPWQVNNLNIVAAERFSS